MNRNGTDHIVDFQLVEQRHHNHGDDTTDGTDQKRGEDRRGQRFGGDGNQTGKCAVQHHGQVDLAEHHLRGDDRGDHPGRGGSIGVHEDPADIGGIIHAAKRQLRAAVEPEPAQPQDKGAKRCQRQVRTGHRLHPAIGAILAKARPQHNGTGKGGKTTGGVNQRRAREIREPTLVQPAGTPLPRCFDRVDEGRQDDREDHERPQLHTFRQGPRDDRSCGGAEHQLEEEVRTCCIAILDIAGTDRLDGFGREELADDVRHRPGIARIHQVIADNPEHESGNGEKRDVLEQLRGDVLRAHQTGFQHGKACGHPHDQEAANQEEKGIEDIGDICADRRRRGSGGGRRCILGLCGTCSNRQCNCEGEDLSHSASPFRSGPPPQRAALATKEADHCRTAQAFSSMPGVRKR